MSFTENKSPAETFFPTAEKVREIAGKISYTDFTALVQLNKAPSDIVRIIDFKRIIRELSKAIVLDEDMLIEYSNFHMSKEPLREIFGKQLGYIVIETKKWVGRSYSPHLSISFRKGTKEQEALEHLMDSLRSMEYLEK